MKLLSVIGTLERGGSERQLAELVKATHPQHAECVVVCLQREGPLAGEIRAAGARVVSLGIRRMWSPIEAVRLGRVMRREQPDVVYAVLFWAYVLALPTARLFAPRALRVQGRRSPPEWDRPGDRRFLALRRLSDSCTRLVIANSSEVAEAVVSAEPELRGRVAVVANGIRPAPEQPHDADGGEPLIVCVANLIAYKGHETLVDALSLVRERPWRTLFVGEGPHRRRVEAAIAASGLGDRIELLGERDDVPALLARAEVAVLASEVEGLPNAVLEAMAHGVPVVATDVGGTRSLLGTGAGLVVPPGDPTALAGALGRMLDDPDLRRRAGENGAELVRELYGIERMRDETLAAMHRALGWEAASAR